MYRDRQRESERTRGRIYSLDIQLERDSVDTVVKVVARVLGCHYGTLCGCYVVAMRVARVSLD